MKKIERAIVSVFDKTGIVEFVKCLVNEFKVKILSTGGTGALLEEYGIPYQKVSDYTQFPEMFNGRVKTIHPKIEGGILYRRNIDKDEDDAKKYDIEPIDMVICNLYNFKEAISKPDINLDDALEMIDIGGPTMIRAAAKNFKDVVVVPHSKYYNQILDEMRENDGHITKKMRISLAYDVFAIMAEYNSIIAQFLENCYNPMKFSDRLIKSYEKVAQTRYGENWDQEAAYYKDSSISYGLQNLTQLGGKQISFNNYLDIDSCLRMLLDFGKEHYVTTIIKHTNPNGVAIDKINQLDSIKKAFSTDPMSAFGGIWGLNKKLNAQVADFIVNIENIFIEVLLAPSFEIQALEILKQKPNMILLEYGNLFDKREEICNNYEIRGVLGGILVQDYDCKPIIKEWNVVSEKKVNDIEKESLIFAYKVSKWAKSNSACFAQRYNNGIYTIGIGAGQQSRIHVVRLAGQKAIEFGHKDELKNSFMGTDSFFPFPDGLEEAVKFGAKAIINPGGSIRDELVIKRANELNCALIFCGKRVFRH
ncbi:MAG: bifunctional phosphoribosylaminoimidazolecarboxamide formyltransferase/IMP cyclohydrolase [Promethearchaeota archaeon]